MDSITQKEILAVGLRVLLGATVSYYTLKWIMYQLDPTTQNNKKARTKAAQLIKRLTETDDTLKLTPSTLSDHEMAIASHLIVPADINVSWSDIAGLDDVIQELRENIVLPVRHRRLYASSKLWKAPTGVLLVGVFFFFFFFTFTQLFTFFFCR